MIVAPIRVRANLLVPRSVEGMTVGGAVPQQAPDDFVAWGMGARHRLVRSAYLISGSEAIAEDRVQDAMIKVAQRWSRLRDEQPTVFARTIIVRDHASWRRRRRDDQDTLLQGSSVNGFGYASSGWAVELASGESRELPFDPSRSAVLANGDVLTHPWEGKDAAQEPSGLERYDATDAGGHPEAMLPVPSLGPQRRGWRDPGMARRGDERRVQRCDLGFTAVAWDVSTGELSRVAEYQSYSVSVSLSDVP